MKKVDKSVVVIFNNIPIIFNIEKSWVKTIEGFESCAEYYIKDRSLIQAIIINLDKNIDKITQNSLTDKLSTSTDEIKNGTPIKDEFNKLNVLPDKNYSEFVISTIKRTVKKEDVLIRQVFYAGLSAYTLDPINLGVLAPTSEGKTYVVTQVMKYFPTEDVWSIGSMSTKALVRQKGILVDKNKNPIEKRVNEIKKEIRLLSKKPEDLESKAELLEELEKILDDSKTLIDLSSKILVFLEPPHHELWNLLKPILSHDTPEIEFPYVDRTDKDGFVTKKVIVRGFPACIFCSAKDESKWEIWNEIQSRFLITSPNMNKEKYFESNILIGQRKGLPSLIQQHVIVSDKEIRLAKTAIIILKKNILDLYKKNDGDYEYKTNSVWIPYYEILARTLQSNRGTDNRAANRIFALLNIIPLSRMHIRPGLIFGKERLVAATLEDLREVMYITQNLSRIPTHKIQFYNEVFLPLYRAKARVDERDDKREKRIALTTAELCEFYKKIMGRSITGNNLKQTYLNELINNGYIDQEDSELDKRAKIYFPLTSFNEEKLSNYNNTDPMDNSLQFSKIILPKNYNSISQDWLNLEILSLWRYPIQLDKFQLLNENGKEACICQFVQEYEKKDKLGGYFQNTKNEDICNGIFGNIEFLGEGLEEFYEKLSIKSELLQNDSYSYNQFGKKGD